MAFTHLLKSRETSVAAHHCQGCCYFFSIKHERMIWQQKTQTQWTREAGVTDVELCFLTCGWCVAQEAVRQSDQLLHKGLLCILWITQPIYSIQPSTQNSALSTVLTISLCLICCTGLSAVINCAAKMRCACHDTSLELLHEGMCLKLQQQTDVCTCLGFQVYAALCKHSRSLGSQM